MTTKHTKTPWKICSRNARNIRTTTTAGNLIATCCLAGGLPAANAAHIVRCVNSHEALVEALENLTEYSVPGALSTKQYQEFLVDAHAALALAKGE